MSSLQRELFSHITHVGYLILQWTMTELFRVGAIPDQSAGANQARAEPYPDTFIRWIESALEYLYLAKVFHYYSHHITKQPSNTGYFSLAALEACSPAHCATLLPSGGTYVLQYGQHIRVATIRRKDWFGDDNRPTAE